MRTILKALEIVILCVLKRMHASRHRLKETTDLIAMQLHKGGVIQRENVNSLHTTVVEQIPTTLRAKKFVGRLASSQMMLIHVNSLPSLGAITHFVMYIVKHGPLLMENV